MQGPHQALPRRCPRLAGVPGDCPRPRDSATTPGPECQPLIAGYPRPRCARSLRPIWLSVRHRQDLRARSGWLADQLRCDRIALRSGQTSWRGPDPGCSSHRPSPTNLVWGTDARRSRAGAGNPCGKTTRDHGAIDLSDQAAARGSGPEQGPRKSGPGSRRTSCGTLTESQKPVKSWHNRQFINGCLKINMGLIGRLSRPLG